jgi:hypothetical protein
MKNVVMRVAWVVALVLCLCFTTLCHAKKAGSSVADCSRIDKKKPPLFIAFERADSKEVVLRLRNNSACPVLIPTNQLEGSLALVKQSNGTLRIEQIEELRNGSRVPVVYNLFNLRGSRDTVMVTEGCLVMPRRLLSQQSIVFAIPLEFFKKHADVGIGFTYQRENDGGMQSAESLGTMCSFETSIYRARSFGRWFVASRGSPTKPCS